MNTEKIEKLVTIDLNSDTVLTEEQGTLLSSNARADTAPSTWPAFDTQLDGLYPGDLMTWFSEAGMGRTSFLLGQALNAWRTGNSVLFITMDMQAQQIARRAAGLDAGLQTYTVSKPSEGLDEVREGVRMHFYSGGMRMKVSEIQGLVHDLKPGFVFIDDADLVQPDTPGFEDEVYEELRMKITTARMVVSVQVGKDFQEVGKSRIDRVGQLSAIVVGLQEGDAPYQQTRRKVMLLKGRNGECGTFQFQYALNPPSFSEVSPD